MPTTDDQFKLAQSWIGTWEDKADFDERYDRLGDLDDAIIESLRAMRAALASRETRNIGLDDGTTITFRDPKDIDNLIEDFLGVGGTEETAAETNVTRLKRETYR